MAPRLEWGKASRSVRRLLDWWARIRKGLLKVKVRDLIRRLEAEGWYLARTRGSHRQFRHPSRPGTVTVAGKPSLEVPPGTLNAILKQSGLKD